MSLAYDVSVKQINNDVNGDKSKPPKLVFCTCLHTVDICFVLYTIFFLYYVVQLDVCVSWLWPTEWQHKKRENQRVEYVLTTKKGRTYPSWWNLIFGKCYIKSTFYTERSSIQINYNLYFFVCFLKAWNFPVTICFSVSLYYFIENNLKIIAALLY